MRWRVVQSCPPIPLTPTWGLSLLLTADCSQRRHFAPHVTGCQETLLPFGAVGTPRSSLIVALSTMSALEPPLWLRHMWKAMCSCTGLLAGLSRLLDFADGVELARLVAPVSLIAQVRSFMTGKPVCLLGQYFVCWNADLQCRRVPAHWFSGGLCRCLDDWCS